MNIVKLTFCVIQVRGSVVSCSRRLSSSRNCNKLKVFWYDEPYVAELLDETLG